MERESDKETTEVCIETELITYQELVREGQCVLRECIRNEAIGEKTIYPKIMVQKELDRPTECIAPDKFQVDYLYGPYNGASKAGSVDKETLTIVPVMRCYYMGDTIYLIRVSQNTFAGIVTLHPNDVFKKRDGRKIGREKAVATIGRFVTDPIFVEKYDLYIKDTLVLKSIMIDRSIITLPRYMKLVPCPE